VADANVSAYLVRGVIPVPWWALDGVGIIGLCGDGRGG